MLLLAINSIDNADNKIFIEKIYTAYVPWLKFRAYRIVNNIDICDDLVQDCMLNIIKHVEKLKSLSVDKQRAYLAVAIDNIAKNYNKRSSKLITMKDSDSADLDFIPDDGRIEDEIDKKYDYATLKTALDNLCDRDRDIIIMKYDLELSEYEIADILQIKKDSVRMTVLRSVKKLKREIDKLEGK